MMALMRSKWAMVLVLLLKIQTFLNSVLILFYIIFYMFLKLPKIYFLFKIILLIIMSTWNFTHIVFFVKDCMTGKIYTTA